MNARPAPSPSARRPRRLRAAGAALLLLAAAGAGAAAPPEPCFRRADRTIASLDPAFASSMAAGRAAALVYETLLQFDYEARPYRLAPYAAEAMPEVSEDGLELTFRLRDDVRFGPDEAFGGPGATRRATAADAVFALKRLADAKLSSPGWWILAGKVEGLDAFREASAGPEPTDYDRDVPGLRALDDRTLRIRLVRPCPDFLWGLALPYASILPREVVEARDFEAMLAMKRAVEGNDEARRRVRGGVAERVARVHYAGFECQIRIDYLTRDFGITDYKTCRDLDRFEWDARDYGYIEQLAFYRAVLRVLLLGNGGRDIPCSIVACEKAEPFRCGVWRVAPWALDIAEKQNEADMARLAECYRTDTWPEPPEYAGLRTLDFPGSRA